MYKYVHVFVFLYLSIYMWIGIPYSYVVFYLCEQIMQMYVQINQGMQASCFNEWTKMPYIYVIVQIHVPQSLHVFHAINQIIFLMGQWHYRAFDAVNTFLKFTQREKTHSLLSHSDKVSSSSLFESNIMIVIRVLKIKNKYKSSGNLS